MQPPRALTSACLLAALSMLLAPGASPASAQQAGAPSPAASNPSCPRWVQTSDPELWMPNHIALADFGSTVITERGLTNKAVTVHAAGSAESAFSLPSDPTDATAVAGAAFAPVGARCFIRRNPTDQLWYTHVEVFDTFGEGTPRWTRTLPVTHPGAGVPEPRVALSRDGSKVVAGGGDSVAGFVLQTFDADGALLSSRSFPSSSSAFAFDASADAGRVALQIGGSRLFVYNTETDVVELEHVESPGQAVAISRDGRRVAMGGRVFRPNDSGGTDPFGRFVVFERDGAGVWTELRRREFALGTDVEELDLDARGERLAFALTHSSNTRFDVHAYDVDADSLLFTHVVENPATLLQLHPSAIKIDDPGRTTVVTSWGDSGQTTHELMAFDETGATLCSFQTRGSALALDLSPGGDRFVVGATSRHVNSFTNRGDVYYGILPAPQIDYAGIPRVGQEVRFDVAGLDEPNWILLVTSRRLPAATGLGLALDRRHFLRMVSPAISLAGFRWVVPPGLAGAALHLQSVKLGGRSTSGRAAGAAPVEYSNVATLRILQ